MDSHDSAEGPNIIFKPESEAEGYRSRWLWSLSQFREAFNEWQNGEEGQMQYEIVFCIFMRDRMADAFIETGG